MNDGYDYRVQVGPDGEGRSVLSFLAGRYAHSSLDDWRERIEAGHVRVDRRGTSPESALRRGQELTWCRPGWDEPEAPLGFAILHRDDELLVVAKPAGLPTLPGAGFLEHTLLSLVRAFDPAASPMHRLGRFTSGLVVFSRTSDARRALSRQWASGHVVKRYRALAAGSPAGDELRVEVPIGPVPYPVLGTVHAASRSGKHAASHVTVVERRVDSFLCDVRIETGRPHQVRIHLAAAGHPLLGDPLYGPGGLPRCGTSARPGDPGYLLHAAEIGLSRPASGEPLTLACAPPPALRERGTCAGPRARPGECVRSP
jgi:23S rRNA pseudouridine1911/1915/1917 synthase